MTWRRRLGLGAVVVVMGLAAFVAAQGVAQAAINSDEAPHPGNSNPNDAHTFLLRRSSDWGVNPDVQLIAYYPKGIDSGTWNNAYIKLRPGGRLTDPLVCQSDGGGGSAPNKYITVTLTRDDGVQRDYHISYNNACNYNDPNHTNQKNVNDRNQLFGRYYLPGSLPSDVNPDTNRYHVYVTIRYHDSVPPNVQNTGNTAQFDVRGNTTGLKIGQRGGGEAEDDSTDGYSFPLRPDYAHVRNGPPVSAVDIPFGLPCNVVGGGLRNKRIGLYDSDNGALPFLPYRVQFRVKEVGGNYLKFINGTEKKADIRDNGYVLQPWDREAKYASAKIRMKTQTNYVMEITGIANGNIIDVHVPGDTIYGDIDCKWEMRPDSSVTPQIQRPNGWVTFTHTATNIKAFKSDPVTSEVRWGKRGVRTTGTISTDNNRVYNPNNGNGSKMFTNDFKIPNTAVEGDEYCQYLWLKPHSYDDNTAYDSWAKGDRACVKVETPDEGENVIVTPVVNGNMDYVEPTETATFDGYVNISNFPRLWDDEWGYTEVARQRPAQRVTATASGGLEVDGPYFTSTTTTYSCPHSQDTKSGSGAGTYCRHARDGNANNTKAKCEANGHTWSGGSCYGTHAPNTSTTCPATYQKISESTCWRYRYKCTYSSSWGAWNGPAPNCMSYWTCPGGAAGSGWSHSAPNCQGWKCQYAPYAQVNQATAPPCEYRCADGTGLRAPQSNGWTGDMNCYIQPSFTLTCYWKNKPQFSESVNSDGRYCNNRDADANEVGVTIGTPVRAVLTANYPGNGAWSSPPPGYGKDGAGTWRQLHVWRWDNFPFRSAEDTVRVVGKPTVKVLGGDVAAGGGFVSDGICSPASSAMIAGWPHIPNYDASGSQFGVFSSSTVTGFSSAMINANSATAPRSLVFANYPTSFGETFGGNFDSNMPCALDHYGDASPTSLPTVGLSSVNSNPTTPTASGAYQGSGTQIGHNPEIKNGQRIAFYTTGNVYISGSGITYQNRGSWQTVQDIPAFKLVVYGANIYIAPSVTELNGIYIAQPNGNAGGNIYTCANNGSTLPNNSLYNSCQNTLTVNGVFIAKKVHLQRTHGTAIRGETAEQFNYLPEVWLAPWPQTNAASEVKYDAIISLPPVL